MNLTAYLEKHKIWHRILEKEDTVHTADAAAATGIPLERVTKSLVFLADKKPITRARKDCRYSKQYF